MSFAHKTKLARRLFDSEELAKRFLDVFDRPPTLPQCIIWVRDKYPLPFLPEESGQWLFLPDFVEVFSADSRPGSHEAHNLGHYYCADLSSVTCVSAIYGATEMPASPSVIDLCASPGGKSVFAWRALRPCYLVANDPVRGRIPALISNMKRCQITPVSVTSSDPSYFAREFPASADLVIVDAPCSGQSLPLKAIPAANAFHPVVIKRNSNRQKRIIANAASVVTPGGYLLYMTCTFSAEENESIVAWLLRKFPDFNSVSVPALSQFRSELSELPCYRIWPWQNVGAGGFVALFQRSGQQRAVSIDSEKIYTIWRSWS